MTRLFDTSSLPNEYQEEHGPFEIYDYDTPLTFEIVDFRRDATKKIKRLEGIREQLELFDEPLDSLLHDVGKNGIAVNPIRSLGNEIFIVYGQHEAAKHAVARFVERFNIEPIILDEQPNKGQTIIDKFEDHANVTGFAIVLLTPDDVGAPKGKTNELNPRARQTVILELGYFLGKLGRERVCVLYKAGVELPSDIHGILYVPMNSPHEWHLKLAQEMKQAGLPIDLNRLA